MEFMQFMKYSWKGHKDRNRHKNRTKGVGKLGWFMSDINRNIPTTWGWARGNYDNDDVDNDDDDGDDDAADDDDGGSADDDDDDDEGNNGGGDCCGGGDDDEDD